MPKFYKGQILECLFPQEGPYGITAGQLYEVVSPGPASSDVKGVDDGDLYTDRRNDRFVPVGDQTHLDSSSFERGDTVMCVDAKDVYGLTETAAYEVLGAWHNEASGRTWVSITDDRRLCSPYDADRFVIVAGVSP